MAVAAKPKLDRASDPRNPNHRMAAFLSGISSSASLNCVRVSRSTPFDNLGHTG